MEFINHVLVTHPSRHEQDIILRSHVYASIILSTENPPSAQPAAPQHGTFFQGNLPSTQPANPAHASSQNVILHSPIFALNTIFSRNLPTTQPSVQQHTSSRRNNGVVILSTSSSNRNHPIRNDRTSAIDRQQMARGNSVMPISRGRAPPVNMLQMERRNRVGDSNSSLRNSNQTIVYGTRQLIDQLDVPVSSNVGELVNIAEEQNDLDLNLRL
ncbi:hypothetical protein KY290_037680 [Solanum tuberosum]|uniref:Uncharacterized protein n=2 Tax=Solanum tuberosum TaxID=4113 RepID=A0ABQ7TWU6_SOLTU|nr:hypothetical protein KY284_037052 [Solanum tuberosum]KAH0637298.1 hypothetical protein KY289_037213 [Solanum tuberosum]KAH0738975.1 hypothetical protein KY290_037680 [Solanum tuberosum]